MESAKEIDTNQEDFVFTLTVCSSSSDDSSVESSTNTSINTMSDNAGNQRNRIRLADPGADRINETLDDGEKSFIPSTQDAAESLLSLWNNDDSNNANTTVNNQLLL